MFVGHIGAALALKRIDRRIDSGVLILAALLPDLLLWTFVMLGIESVVVPPGFAARHYLTFLFPYSHSVAAGCGWSAAAAVATWMGLGTRFPGRVRAAMIVAAAVFSHILLDALVHVPGVPLAGAGSAMVGLGLWNRKGIAIAVELVVAASGAWLGLRGSGLAPGRVAGLLICLAAAAILSVAGLTVAPPPPTASAAALPAIVAIGLCAGVGVWAGRP